MKFSNKLSLAILMTGMIILITVSYTIYKISYNSIIKSQLMYTKSIADEVSDDIDHILHEKIKTTLTLANTPIIIKALEKSNLSYANLSGEKRTKSIRLLNERWKSTKDLADSFILKFTDNKVSHFLKNQQALLKGEYGEIFLTNKFGALVASTSKLSTLAHGHKYWWLGSYLNGEGAVFFDDRGYDDSVGGYVLGLVVPIRKGTEIIGILKCNLNILGSVSELISGAEDKLIGKFKLTRSGGMVVFEEGFEPLTTQIHYSIFKKLKSKNTESFIITESGEKYIVGRSEIKLTKGEKGYGFGGTFESIDHKMGNTGESWYVLCYRQMSVVLAPITESIKSLILMGFAIILILVLVSYLFGRKIAKPLAIINKATKKIGKGDFESRIDVMRKDEFGDLAHSFNSMAGKLQQTTTTVELLENEVKHRKQIEETLRKSEAKYRLIVENQTDMIVAFDSVGCLLFVSPSYSKTFDKIEDELVGKKFISLIHEDDRETVAKVIDIVHKPPYTAYTEERAMTKNGWQWQGWLNTAILNEEGKVESIVAVGRDINDRKQTEEALRESEEKYRNILESIEEGYYETDLVGNFTFFNDAMCRIRGYSRDELMGMNNRGYMDPATAKKVFEAYSQVYTTGRAINGYEWETIRKDGTKGYVEVSASLMKNPEDKPIGFQGIVRDVTERKFAEEEKKRLEAQLQEGLKMEAIATLAGGVAHEFNNALMGIMGNIELLKMDLPEDETRDKYFERMKGSGHRMSRLTAQLLAYAEGGKYQPKNLKLDDFVIQTLPILQHDLNPDVRVETHFPRDISYIKADYAQMQMVLSAILANSNEAIEDTGLIKIAAENIDLDEDFINHRPGLKPGPYVCLTVEDDGEGMDEETRNGIFEPFFTTKFQGRGMGMAAVHGIVRNHDGWISVDSELGRGTKVQIYLPAIEIKVEKPKKAKAEVVRGSGTILMIEDEDVVIEVTQMMLEMLGYRVMVAKTGKDAIHISETFDGQIDLALLDIKLPDIDGRNLYPLIMKSRPDLKVIVFSGYSIDGPAREILNAGAQDFIQKPFSLATLSEKLKEVFEGK